MEASTPGGCWVQEIHSLVRRIICCKLLGAVGRLACSAGWLCVQNESYTPPRLGVGPGGVSRLTSRPSAEPISCWGPVCCWTADVWQPQFLRWSRGQATDEDSDSEPRVEQRTDTGYLGVIYIYIFNHILYIGIKGHKYQKFYISYITSWHASSIFY